MNFATKTSRKSILIWALWLLVFLAALASPITLETQTHFPFTAGLASPALEKGKPFPWQVRTWRWKKHARKRYLAWQRQYRQARRLAALAHLVMLGAVPLAEIVGWFTRRQVRYQVGALPVLYALLESLQVRQIVNNYCPTRSPVDHGTVALVIILNRLTFPLPLYRIAHWVEQTTLPATLGVPAEKFNDDRLERTLDALFPHLESIWTEIVTIALRKAKVNLSFLYYDLTAFIAHGRYAKSRMIDFGFAHNTPSNKRKLKLGLNTLADGNLPWFYRLWSGRSADTATVQQNMAQLMQLLKENGCSLAKMLLIGDRAMLNAEIAHSYHENGLRYLGGLRGCYDLLLIWNDEQFLAHPLVEGPNPRYWGRGCTVTFEHEGKKITHKGLVVVSGPLRDQHRQARRELLQDLDAELCRVRGEIGQPRMGSIKAVQRRANARLRASKVGHLVTAEAIETSAGGINLVWQVDTLRLAKLERLDGRYLLVTNDWQRSHREIFQLYRDKDGGEKRFAISKGDLKISPLYLHKDQRIASMMMLNMLALLVYSLLERQIRQQGLQLTTRELIRRLDDLTLIETHYLDGSIMRRLTDLTPEMQAILPLVWTALEDFFNTPGWASLRPALPQPPLQLRLPILA